MLLFSFQLYMAMYAICNYLHQPVLEWVELSNCERNTRRVLSLPYIAGKRLKTCLFNFTATLKLVQT